MKTFIEVRRFDDNKTPRSLDLKVQGKIIAKHNNMYFQGNTDIDVLARITIEGQVYINKYWIKRNKNLRRSVWAFLRRNRSMWKTEYPHIRNIAQLDDFPKFAL